MSEINNILTALKELDQITSFNIFIPSLQKDLKFKQLSTEQLKSLLKTVVDSPVYNSQFIITFNDIIKKNCLDDTVETKNFTVYDKLFVLFKMKIESLSSEFKFQLNDSDETPQKFQIVDIKNHFENFVKKQYSFPSEIIEQEAYSLICDLPTIDTENKLEKELHKNIKMEVKTPEELREIIGETFINELTKYISKITVGSNTLDLLSLDFKNRIKVVEQLPTNVINKVLKFIENYRSKTKELTSISIDGVEKDIPQDASFFNI
jgi:hypothetical protein